MTANVFARFTCVPDADDTWMVWDTFSGVPASLGGCVLRRREYARAEAAHSILNRIYKNRLDLSSMRADAGVEPTC